VQDRLKIGYSLGTGRMAPGRVASRVSHAKGPFSSYMILKGVLGRRVWSMRSKSKGRKGACEQCDVNIEPDAPSAATGPRSRRPDRPFRDPHNAVQPCTGGPRVQTVRATAAGGEGRILNVRLGSAARGGLRDYPTGNRRGSQSRGLEEDSCARGQSDASAYVGVFCRAQRIGARRTLHCRPSK
jgi:hypothetical protein